MRQGCFVEYGRSDEMSRPDPRASVYTVDTCSSDHGAARIMEEPDFTGLLVCAVRHGAGTPSSTPVMNTRSGNGIVGLAKEWGALTVAAVMQAALR
ncbi:hypothetical protein CHU98_g12352 [Xylaria longipes]|nr:hypothetical protein CHU98_g12352 [Xylaria longipes]